MPCVEFDSQERALLLQIARASIVHGFEQGGPLEEPNLVEAGLMSGILASPRATFVTLKEHGELRGCIGSLEVKFPLAADVARNAFNAAFIDPRFRKLQLEELETIRLEVTVLAPHTQISVDSEGQLLEQLEPGRDGLVLEHAGQRATFLPQVWEQLPDPQQFLDHLKVKAGIPLGYWSDAVNTYRYHAESFAETGGSQ